MIQLPNGCRASEPTVIPVTWNNKKDFDPKKVWVVHYRFYNSEGKVKQVQVRGMNDLMTWKEKRDATEILLEEIENELKAGYNPIIKSFINANGAVQVTDNSPLIDALQFGLSKSKKRITEKTWKDIRATVNFIRDYVDTSTMTVGDIKRRDVLCLLDKIEEAKTKKEGEFTNNNFNHFRKYLGILFGELVQLQVIETNPVDKYLLKRNVISEERETLTPNDRKKIRQFIAPTYPTFYRFIQVFFHSGSRLTEILKVKGQEVNLEEQYFKVLILKGRQWIKVKKVIKDVVLPYWKELMSKCGPDDYVFSDDLTPGATPINAAQVTKRWRKHVKEKLGITKDLYSLKHLHSDEIAEQLDIKAAQKHNSHTTQKMAEHYATGEKLRKAKTIKEIENEF